MAPLKQQTNRMSLGDRQAYPWLRGHGSIEAPSKKVKPAAVFGYPWLRGHGSIEADLISLASFLAERVSMAERSWLH